MGRLGRLGACAAWLVLLACAALDAGAGAAQAACDGTGSVALLVSPRTPHAGGLVRVLAASDDVRIGDLVVASGPDPEVTGTVRRLGGPPWSASLALMGVAAGTYELHAIRNGAVVGCTRFEVGAGSAPGWSPTVAGRDERDALLRMDRAPLLGAARRAARVRPPPGRARRRRPQPPPRPPRARRRP